jgi:hypothetical protein
MDNEPDDGFIKVVSNLIVVDLPAPFGPKNPKTWPFFTDKIRSFTAVIDPYDLDKCSTLIQDTINLRSSY